MITWHHTIPSVLTTVKLDHYCAVVAQWQDRMTQAVADGIRRHRKELRISTQQLADRTAQLGLPIQRSVLANLENGRRGSVSVAELLILAAALGAAPMDLLYPVGLEEKIEMLPGRQADPLGIVSWFCGDSKLDLTGESTTLGQAKAGEESNVYLIKYHKGLIDKLRTHEAGAARASADALAGKAAAAEAAEAARVAEVTDPALRKAADDAAEAFDRLLSEAAYRHASVEEWKIFIREPLLRTRAEMRRRGMLVPPVPPELGLDEDAAELTGDRDVGVGTGG
jgi:hypothetical protein